MHIIHNYEELFSHRGLSVNYISEQYECSWDNSVSDATSPGWPRESLRCWSRRFTLTVFINTSTAQEHKYHTAILIARHPANWKCHQQHCCELIANRIEAELQRLLAPLHCGGTLLFSWNTIKQSEGKAKVPWKSQSLKFEPSTEEAVGSSGTAPGNQWVIQPPKSTREYWVPSRNQ